MRAVLKCGCTAASQPFRGHDEPYSNVVIQQPVNHSEAMTSRTQMEKEKSGNNVTLYVHYKDPCTGSAKSLKETPKARVDTFAAKSYGRL